MPQNKGALSIHLTAVALHGATLLGLCCGIFESWRFLRSKVQRGKSTETCRNSKPFILRIGTLWAFPQKNLHFQVGRFWRWLLWLVFVKKFGRRDDMLQVFLVGKFCKADFWNNLPIFGYFLPPKLDGFHSNNFLCGFEAMIVCLCGCYRASPKRKRYRYRCMCVKTSGDGECMRMWLIFLLFLSHWVFGTICSITPTLVRWEDNESTLLHISIGMPTALRIQSGFWAAMGFPVTDPISRRHWYKSRDTHEAIGFSHFGVVS